MLGCVPDFMWVRADRGGHLRWTGHRCPTRCRTCWMPGTLLMGHGQTMAWPLEQGHWLRLSRSCVCEFTPALPSRPDTSPSGACLARAMTAQWVPHPSCPAVLLRKATCDLAIRETVSFSCALGTCLHPWLRNALPCWALETCVRGV